MFFLLKKYLRLSKYVKYFIIKLVISMKKIIFSLIAIIFIAGVCGCGIKSDSSKFKEEYESLNGQINEKNSKTYPEVIVGEDNPFVYSNADEIISLLSDKKTGVVYLGYNTCPWCRNIIAPLQASAKENNIGKIYYMDLKNERDQKGIDSEGNVITIKEGSEAYKKLLVAFDEYLDDYNLTHDGKTVPTNEKRIYVPLVIFIKEGEVVGYHCDTISSQKDPYVLLDEDGFNELKGIYNNYMEKLITCEEGGC